MSQPCRRLWMPEGADVSGDEKGTMTTFQGATSGAQSRGNRAGALAQTAQWDFTSRTLWAFSFSLRNSNANKSVSFHVLSSMWVAGNQVSEHSVAASQGASAGSWLASRARTRTQAFQNGSRESHPSGTHPYPCMFFLVLFPSSSAPPLFSPSLPLLHVYSIVYIHPAMCLFIQVIGRDLCTIWPALLQAL